MQINEAVIHFPKLRKSKVKTQRLTSYVLRIAGEQYRFFERVTRYTWRLYVILGSEEINGSLSETCPLRCGPTTRDRKIYDKARLNFFHANNQPTNASAFLYVHTYSCIFELKIREWEKGLSYKRTFSFIYLLRDWTCLSHRRSLATRYWIIINSSTVIKRVTTLIFIVIISNFRVNFNSQF